jgi:hypothetical protein
MTTYSIAVGVSVLLIILLILLMVLLFKAQKNKTQAGSSLKESLHLLNVTALSLPTAIEKIPSADMRAKIPHQIFRVFETLDYQNNIQQFTKTDWHSWQVSILLSLYKRQMDFRIAQPQSVFPKEIMQIDDKGLRQIVNDIMVKYRRDVEFSRSKDYLCKDLIWTGREVAVLFFFLSKYKNFPRGLQ